jgi:hypothetical protein
MTRTEEYRLRAKEAEEQAAKTNDSFAKHGFLEIARQYREMAQQAEQHGW